MKSKLLFAAAMALALAAGQGAYAQASKGGETATAMPPAKSTRARAEVLAECLTAQKAGKIPKGECPEYGMTTAKAGAPPSRAEVMAECRVAQKAGLIPQGECPEYGTPQGTGSAKK
jgi:hypothetical protein